MSGHALWATDARFGYAKENAHKYANTHHNEVPAEDEDVDVAHVLSWCVTEATVKHVVDMCRLARFCRLWTEGSGL